MIDNVEWSSGEYELVCRPDASTLLNHITSEYAEDIYQLEYILPADNSLVNEYFPLDNQQAMLIWTKEIVCKHGAYTATINSYWGYNANTDDWELLKSVENEAIGGYALFQNNELIEINVDFSGYWRGDYGEFTISNYTDESFDLKWGTYSSHFSIDELHSDGGNLLYNGSNNTTVDFDFLSDKTRIIINHQKSRTSFESALVEITEDLPLLK